MQSPTLSGKNWEKTMLATERMLLFRFGEAPMSGVHLPQIIFFHTKLETAANGMQMRDTNSKIPAGRMETRDSNSKLLQILVAWKRRVQALKCRFWLLGCSGSCGCIVALL